MAAPCKWLVDRARQSMLAEAAREFRAIPNGVDQDVFKPGNRLEARAQTGIPTDAKVLLFTANCIRDNPWKDYKMIRSALARLGERQTRRKILFIGLGDDAASEYLGTAEVRFIPYQKDTNAVARFYQAADLYVHAAKADTFPNTVLEALACGIPVVGTNVGGIP